MTAVKAAADKESIFNRIADYVSAAMGRPTNIMIWLVLVVGWTLLFAVHVVSANANFLPGWFTGTAFNFPLNLVTTVAELFIGFLVAAAANRSERNLELTLAAIANQEEHIEDVETKLSEEVASNTALTQQVHELTSQIHDFLTAANLSQEMASNTTLTQQVHELTSQIHDFLTAGKS
jgi:low affinity Fe/Cu permease